MKRWLMTLSVVCVAGMMTLGANKASAAGTNGLAFGRSSAEEILDAAAVAIERLNAVAEEVPQEMYDFYFKLEQATHPELYSERGTVITLDQNADRCPGTLLFGPEEEDIVIRTCGSTLAASNDCSYPNCRYGRDVVMQLEVFGFDAITISTAGSSFDTYLCMYEDVCCDEGGESRSLYESNDNNPSICNGQRLAAGISTCVSPGTYYLVLDGASPAARGSYCVTITWEYDDCD
jgi:hypothetical protein